jgi:hypothetical protein
MSTIANAIWTKDPQSTGDESTCCKIILTHPDGDHRHRYHHAEEEIYELMDAGAHRAPVSRPSRSVAANLIHDNNNDDTIHTSSSSNHRNTNSNPTMYLLFVQ